MVLVKYIHKYEWGGHFESKVFISTRTTTNTEITISHLLRTNFQLHKTPFFHIVTTIGCAFSSYHVDECTNLPKTYNAIATAETHYLPPKCAYILYLVSTSIDKSSMDVSRCNIFHMENSLLPLTHFHTRYQTVICTNAPPPNMSYWWEGLISITVAPTLASDNVGQH